jgi:hypothetical protein
MIRLPINWYSNSRGPNKTYPTGWKVWWLVEAAAAAIVREAVVVEVPSGPTFAGQTEVAEGAAEETVQGAAAGEIVQGAAEEIVQGVAGEIVQDVGNPHEARNLRRRSSSPYPTRRNDAVDDICPMIG